MAEQKNIMSYETVALDDEQSALVILDQTKLPYEVEVLHLTEQKDIWDAIYLLKVRGAPAIGVAAMLTFAYILCGVADAEVVFGPWATVLPWLSFAAVIILVKAWKRRGWPSGWPCDVSS